MSSLIRSKSSPSLSKSYIESMKKGTFIFECYSCDKIVIESIDKRKRKNKNTDRIVCDECVEMYEENRIWNRKLIFSLLLSFPLLIVSSVFYEIYFKCSDID